MSGFGLCMNEISRSEHPDALQERCSRESDDALARLGEHSARDALGFAAMCWALVSIAFWFVYALARWVWAGRKIT